ADEVHEAARAVAALLDLAAVGIEDTVTEVNFRSLRGFNQQNLVAAHAEVPVRERAKLRTGEIDLLAHTIEDNEVVAEPLHLGEADPARHRGLPNAASNFDTAILPLREKETGAQFCTVTVPFSV